MSEIRQNILTGEWTIYASNRFGKPYDFKKHPTREAVERKCPFCPGNEHMTPEPVYSDGEDGNWTIRVFPNLYPALSCENAKDNDDLFYTSVCGIGHHEVVVDTPDHTKNIHDLTAEEINKVLLVIRERYADMKKRDGVKYVQVFKNSGPEAGASINHSHWQIIGGSLGGLQQDLERINCDGYFDKNGSCLMCDMIKHEKTENKRVVAENERFIVFVPFASKAAFELYIVPKEHINGYENMDDEHIKDFAYILKPILDKVQKLFKGLSYNICFQDIVEGDRKETRHWYARILPRIGTYAGYEFGTGTFINPIIPEFAADKYNDME